MVQSGGGGVPGALRRLQMYVTSGEKTKIVRIHAARVRHVARAGRRVHACFAYLYLDRRARDRDAMRRRLYTRLCAHAPVVASKARQRFTVVEMAAAPQL
jgi:hypothetical protein